MANNVNYRYQKYLRITLIVSILGIIYALYRWSSLPFLISSDLNTLINAVAIVAVLVTSTLAENAVEKLSLSGKQKTIYRTVEVVSLIALTGLFFL